MRTIIFLSLFVSILHRASATRITYGDNLIISQPVYEDLYIAGGTVTIDAPVYGDLIVTGGKVYLNDSVMNDVLVAGGQININGYVGDDIRCAGGEVYLSKDVRGDMLAAGGKITINSNVVVNGSVIAAGGDIIVNGIIRGILKTSSGSLVLNGQVGDSVNCQGGKIEINGKVNGSAAFAAPQILLGKSAHFGSTVRYWKDGDKLNFGQSLKSGNAIYDPSLKMKTGKWYFLGSSTFVFLLWYIGMAFLMILIIEYLFSGTMHNAGNAVYTAPGRSLGLGLLFLVGIPLLILISFITIIGIPIAIMLLVVYITIILLGNTITAVVAANWLNNRFNYDWNIRHIVLSAFVMFIFISLIFMTPFLGGLLKIILSCIAFGAILINVNWRKWKRPVSK